MIGPQGENLIFVISPPRAGSTLLQRILAGSADVFATAEPWIMLHPLYALRNSGHTADYNAEWSHAALTDFCENLDGGIEAYSRAVAGMGRELYNNALKPSGRRCFLDKTPRYYFIAAELLRAFPEAKFVFLLRHPLAVLSSILSSWVHDDWQRLDNYACDLCEAPGRLAEALDHFGEQAIVVNYEELVKHPENTVRSLCGKLGLVFEPAMLEYGQREKPKGRMGDNVGIQRHNRPVTESCDKWKSELASPRQRYFAGRYLEFLDERVVGRLGYPKAQLIAEWHDLPAANSSMEVEWETHASKFFDKTSLIPAKFGGLTQAGAQPAEVILKSLMVWAEQWPAPQIGVTTNVESGNDELSAAARGCLEQAQIHVRGGNVKVARDYIERTLDLAPNHAELCALLNRVPLDAARPPDPNTLAAPQIISVSVIVSTYAAEKYLRACLGDIEAQTIAEKLEIIVIDSGSPENERAIVEEFQTKYSNIRYVRTEREPLYIAWNRGVKMARGRYVVNANTDDSRRPDAFQILLEAMEAHPEAELAYAHYGMSDAANDPFPPKAVFRSVRHEPYHPGQLLFYCITGCLQFWRKSALEKIGGFDESLKCVGDYEILLRFMRQGMKPVLVPEILSTFFINRKGLSFGSDTAFKEDIKVKEHYRNAVQAEEIFAVDPSKPRELAKAWINLGNMAAAVAVPWDDQPHSFPEYAISCYQKAVACDPDCKAAWHNLAALSVRMGITDPLSKTFRAAQPGIDGIIAHARLNRNLVGFDIAPKIQGYYFQRAGVRLEQVAATPIAQHRPRNDSALLHGPVVSWEGSYLDLGSLSHINRQLTDRLSDKKEFAVVTVGTNAIPSSMQHDREWKRRSRKLHAESPANVTVTVRHQWPPDWSRPAQGALVVIQPWEFGALPVEWVEAAAHVDEFWVPSNYVRSVYVSSGVDPSKVQVIPNGVDVRRYRAAAKPFSLETTKRFKFLFVGGTIDRKGPDVLLQAYLQSFTDADDVCLVIKDFGGSGVYQGMTMNALIERARQRPGAPEILHLTQELTPDQMPGLFTACDCLVHPYRGEGFGLPILEAMACARPVVVTRGGAADDFVSEESGWFIDSTRRSIGTTVSKIPLVAEGWLLEPDVNHLASLLQHAAANPEEGRAKGEAGARLARDKYDWSAVAAQVADRLKIVVQKVARQRAEISGDRAAANSFVRLELPRCAELGNINQAKESLARKDLAQAWKAACVAVEERPFNPPAWYLLGKISLVFGDFECARRCLDILRSMVPAWGPVEKFAASLPGGNDGQPCGFELPAGPSQPRLSVCLIVKNEEKFLKSCLKSVQGLAHQIVVVDTGSQDRTMEIARECGAEVYTFAWCDDFGAARNAALEHATGDWILVLDADEELSLQGREALQRELRDRVAMAYRMPISEAGRAGEGCHYVPRLFRNAPGIYFSGRIHENAFGAVEVLRQEWGLDNRLGKAELIHHGYTADVTASRDKVGRNRRLLEMAVKESPHDANLLMNLGLELVRSKKLAAGIEKYLAALRLLAAMPSGSVVPELRETLLTQLSTHLLAAGRFNEVVTILQSPLATEAGLTASLHYALGLALMELRQHQAGADHFRQCLTKRNQPGLTPLNPEIRKAAPNHCLGLCLITLKQWPAAEQALRAALVDEPGSVVVKLDLARVLASQGGAVDALKLLHEMISESAGDARIWLLGGEIAMSQPELLEFALDWTGEALKHISRDQEVALQRAEALLLSGKIEQSRPLYRANRDADNLRALAALALIELIADSAEPCFSLADQAAVGREFVQWYRRLLAFDAGPIIEQINTRLPQLRAILPSAAAALEAALADAVA